MNVNYFKELWKSSLMILMLCFGLTSVWGQATLPFSFNGGRNDISSTTGLSHSGLGTDYSESNAKLKFDNTGDLLTLHFNGIADELSFTIRFNGSGSFGGTYQVVGSTDGTNFNVSLFNLGSQSGNTNVNYDVSNIPTDVKYIRWIYTTKSSGNIGLGNINLTGTAAPTCTTPEFLFDEAIVNKIVIDEPFTNEFISNNTSAFVWSSTDTGVATVDANGEVTIVGVGTTEIRVNQAADDTYCAVVDASYILNVAAVTYAITAISNNEAFGTVSLAGNIITATPAAGYTYASPAYTVTEGSATVNQNGNEFTVTPSSDATVQINFEAKPSYTLSLITDGSAYTEGDFPYVTYEGDSIELPTLADCGTFTFVGWDTNSSTTSAPTYAGGATYTTTNANVTLYAVYSETVGTPESWERVTTLNDIVAGTYVILNGTYYLPNSTTSSSSTPTAVNISTNGVSIGDNTLVGTIANDMQWTFTGTNAAMTITSATNNNYLYNTSANNGTRVGDTSDTWAFETYSTGFAMKDANNNRFCAVYTTAPDWRSYTSRNHNNYGENSGILDIYKKSGGSTTTYTTNPGCDAPQLVVSETTLPDFTYMVGNGPSVSQEFEISGLNLDGSENVTVALGVDSAFEISTTIDGTYSNTFSLTGFEGDVTTVYVRLQANEVVGNYTDTITISGYEQEKEVALNGEVSPLIPVAPPTITVEGVANGEDTYWETATITLATTTDGATIYYTTDGSEPTTASTAYTIAFDVTETTTIKAFATADGLDDSTVAEKEITITNPATADIPHEEAFNNTLGDWISYTNAGVNWTPSANGAFIDGYPNQSELVWLISPKLLSVGVNGLLLSFDHESQYTGNDLEIRYSTDYAGYGDPTAATWTTASTVEYVESGSVTNLAISVLGDVHIALVYTDIISFDQGDWTISNLSIEEPSTDPTLSVSVAELAGFTYGVGNGPSASQNFVLSGENLDGSEDVTLLADTGFEISLNDADFEDDLLLTSYNGDETNIYVRLKTGLGIDTYEGIILIEGYEASAEVNVLGNVLAVPVITEADDLTAQVDVSFSYQIIATDEPFSYMISSDALPTGLTLNEGTGLISGTPTVAGEFIFGVTVENAAGESEEGIFMIDIAKGTQTVAGLADINAYFGDADITLPETTEQGFTIVYDMDLSDVATISGNTLSITGIGTVEFMAYTEDGDANYEDYTEVFTVTVTEEPEAPWEDFETGTKGSYGAAPVVTTAGEWYMDDALLGSDSNEKKNGVRAVRIRNSGYIQTNFDITEGIGDVTVHHANFGSDSGGSWVLKVSNDQGQTWAAFESDEIMCSSTLEPVTISVNIGGDVRVRIEKIGGNRVNIDDIYITNYSSSAIVWTTDNVWSNEFGPTGNDDAVIEGDLVVGTGGFGSFIAKTLTVNGSISIQAGNYVMVEGKITNNGEFTVESDGILYQNNYTGTNEGNITVKRAANPMKRLDYTLWSSPVSGMPLNQFSNVSPNGGTGTIWNRVYELGADAWSSIWESYDDASTSSDTFVDAKGYLYRAFNSYDAVETTIFTGVFTGVPNNGDYTINTPNMFDAIGNPYPSPIDADDFLTNNNADAIYFWTNVNSSNGTEYTNNNWASYTTLGGVGVTIGDSGIIDPNSIPADNMHIQPGQGFVVYTEENSVSFNNAMRINSNGSFFRQMSNERHRFWLNLSNEEVVFNQILVGYVDNATQGVDTAIDGKMFAYEGNAIYSIIENSDENYVIQGRSLPFTASDVVVLGFRAVNSGSFTISLNNFDGLFTDNQNIYLKDNFTQAVYNLKDGAYTFVSEEGIFNTRFEVVYQTTMSVENPVANNANWVVYSQEDGCQIQTQGFELKTVQVYDLLGRTIYTSKAEGTVHQIPALGADSVYIVKVTTTDNVVLSKKVK